jgi:hypothetical protein
MRRGPSTGRLDRAEPLANPARPSKGDFPMKRLIALCGALVLALAMAAPAAANEKVKIDMFSGGPFWFFTPVDVTTCTGPPFWEGWCANWECVGRDDENERIHYSNSWTGALWLWYPKSVDTTDPAEYMPDGEAWPWIKGKSKGSGIDAFSSAPEMGGKVISGKYKINSRMYDHVIANPETWTTQDTGRFWGINVPGKGNLLHESGNFRYTTKITFVPGEDPIEEGDFLRFRGNSTLYDHDADELKTETFEELCDYFDMDLVVY